MKTIRRQPVSIHIGKFSIYTTVKITSEFKNVSVTVGVVDGLALHGKLLRRGFDYGRSSILLLPVNIPTGKSPSIFIWSRYT